MPVRVVALGTGLGRVDTEEVSRRARSILRRLKCHNAELSILLTDDERMRELNANYRKKNRSTDVLAFAMGEGEFAAVTPGLLGDVVISVPYAKRQAVERGRSLLEEMTTLLAHGILHLLGWDHETAAKDRAMREECARLCGLASPTRRVRRSPNP